jgi:glycosyltransferase involved in cell wall biosynthesis
MYNSVFYYSNVFRIGGVETFFYEIARKYADRDITLLYKTGDPEQLQRIAQFIRIKKWDGREKIQCRQAIFGYSFDLHDLDLIQAEEYIQIIHADFGALRDRIKPKVDKRFSRYIAVSENNAKEFEKLTGIRCEVCYNPITLDKPRKVLHLLSATRLSPEKGYGRMQMLANALDAAGVRYIWTIYTDSTLKVNSPNVVHAGTRLDIRDFIADADYLVQLSDTEGYPYSLLEALCLGTPLIVTDLPSNPESQVVDGVNAIVLPFDMSEIPIDRIVKGLKK